MATVYHLLPTPEVFFDELQRRTDHAQEQRHRRFVAVLLLQRMTRGFLIRKHVAWLDKNATTIQCAFRVHRARKFYRAALRRAVRTKHASHYNLAARRVQALWRGHYSRRTKFCFKSYRRWLAVVQERGERRAAEAAEYGARSRADDLQILEEEARQWLAFVVFKLHHMLRTAACAGVYSDPATMELSEFEKLLKSIKYTEYMKRLKRKYNVFVKKHRPNFSNKRLFPVIGEGADYWYMSLPEMYELTAPMPRARDTRHSATHRGPQHEKPFLWKRVRTPPHSEIKMSQTKLSKVSLSTSPTPPGSREGESEAHRDPRFHLYVRHYTPQPDLFDYVNYHINALLARKCSIQNVEEA